MSKNKIKEDLDETVLEELGYRYSIMEGACFSLDNATVIYISRKPYQREVSPFMPGLDEQHEANIQRLRDAGFLED